MPPCVMYEGAWEGHQVSCIEVLGRATKNDKDSKREVRLG